MHRTAAALLLISIALSLPAYAQITAEQPLSRIAFGSCAVQDAPQPIWNAILAADPQLFLFLGDNIYGDTRNMDTLRARYERLAAQPGYQKLLRGTPVLATWDDHDYGEDDAFSTYPMKEASQQIFLDFFDVPQDSPRRQRPGIYDAFVFGPPDKRVQVILLDTRYFRSPFGRNNLNADMHERGYGPYGPNIDPEATMLGEAQWAWLAEQLTVPAEIRLIGSSIQVISAEHGWEVWKQLPHEKQRLYDLIDETNANGVIFLSGDVHWGELSRHTEAPYPLHDLTSSALNQEWLDALNLPNSQRVGGMVYPYPNFGLIEIDWETPDPVIRLSVRNQSGNPVILHQIHLSELTPDRHR